MNLKFGPIALVSMWLCAVAALAGCGGGEDAITDEGRAQKQSAVKRSDDLRSEQIQPMAAITIPVISYTDTLTAPTRGGENGMGGYLSIFGSNFGAPADLGRSTRVLIGGVEVANYRSLGLAKVGARLGIQQITVQVGSLGGAAVGVPLPVKVVVNGVSSESVATFTPTAGRVLFVALNANPSESNAAPDAIDRPYRWLQNMDSQPAKGVYFAMRAGDQIVVRGGRWSDATGVSGSWLTFGMGQSARNGTPDAWIHFTAYPGEEVHYTAPPANRGGFQGPWESIAGTSGEYVAFSNFRMDVAPGASGRDENGEDISQMHRDAAPFNLQYTAGHWRVVNNEIGPWYRGQSTILNAGGVAGHGDDVAVLGNHIHDIEGTSELQNHGIYADTTAQNWNVGYNWIHGISGGSLIQFNDNSGGAGTMRLPFAGNRIWPGFVGIEVHHNWLEDAAKYGVNFNDQGSTQRGTYQGRIWNNVIIGTKLPPLRILSTQPKQSLWFAFNTIHNAMTEFSGTGNGYVRSEGWSSPRGGHVLIDNKFYNNIFSLGPDTVLGTQWFMDAGSKRANAATYDFKNNLYDYSSYKHNQPLAPAGIGDSAAVIGNPLFVNMAASDFRLQLTSPALNAARTPLPGFSVLDDFSRLRTRTPGTVTDIGAFVTQ